LKSKNNWKGVVEHGLNMSAFVIKVDNHYDISYISLTKSSGRRL